MQPAAAGRTPLSAELFGIDWASHLPLELSGGVRLEVASVEDVARFVAAHYAAIFGAHAADRRFLVEGHTAAKTRFLELSDRFMFRDGGQTIGVLVGNPLDWSTYYWRTVAFVPTFQGRGLLAAALRHTDEVMAAAGVVRVEGETAPNNQRQLRLLSRLGYCVSGTINSERWGTLLRLTKYLRRDAEERFTTQFCRDSFRPVDNPAPQGGHDEEVRHGLSLSLDDVPGELVQGE